MNLRLLIAILLLLAVPLQGLAGIGMAFGASDQSQGSLQAAAGDIHHSHCHLTSDSGTHDSDSSQPPHHDGAGCNGCATCNLVAVPAILMRPLAAISSSVVSFPPVVLTVRSVILATPERPPRIFLA